MREQWSDLARSLARRAGPTACVIVVALLAGDAWYRVAPESDDSTLEGVIVDTQVRRARAAPPADVLVIGDSSALMGVDAPRLSALLGGQRVESLATIGYLGPAGYGKLLEIYARSGQRPRKCLVLLHGVTLGVDESLYYNGGFEARVLESETFLRPFPGVGARRKIYGRISPYASPLLPGVFGSTYGWKEDLENALAAGHGTLVDPNPPFVGNHQGFVYRISPDVRRRLPRLRDSLKALKASEVVMALTPIPASLSDAESLASRARAVASVASLLDLEGHVLELPPSFEDGDFTSITHLGARGRAHYTEAVARVLR